MVLGVSNTGNLHTGAGYASGGKANIQDITITKYVDSCSNAILNACCTGARLDTAYLVRDQCDRSANGLPDNRIERRRADYASVVTRRQRRDERLTENITLHFGKFKYSFQLVTTKAKASGRHEGLHVRHPAGREQSKLRCATTGDFYDQDTERMAS